jgi:hypothetical protein
MFIPHTHVGIIIMIIIVAFGSIQGYDMMIRGIEDSVETADVFFPDRQHQLFVGHDGVAVGSI